MQTQPRQAPKREGCKEAILALLEQHGGEVPVKELEEELREMGYSYKVIRQAKALLKQRQVVLLTRLYWEKRAGKKILVHSSLYLNIPEGQEWLKPA